VYVPRLGHEVHRLALLRRLAAVDAGDDVVGLVVDLGRAVDVGVRAELLDEVHHGLEALSLAGGLHVLGADPDGDLLAGLAGLGGRIAVHRQVGATKVECAALHVDLEQVHRGGADEAGHEDVVGVVVHVPWCVDLLQDTVLEHGHPVAHRHGLDLVVGHVDGGDAEPALQCGDLASGLDPQFRVEVGQRLVHQEDLRGADDRAAHRHPLALTTGERLGLAVEILLEVEDLGGLGDPFGDLCLVLAGDLQREAHVVRDGHVRVERVVLEHHRDVAVLGRQVRDVALADADRTAVDVLEPGEHPQRGGLPAAGGADQDEELPVADLDVELVDRRALRAREEAGGLVESHCCHGSCSLHRQERAGRSEWRVVGMTQGDANPARWCCIGREPNCPLPDRYRATCCRPVA
jgi:hypothetical protein